MTWFWDKAKPVVFLQAPLAAIFLILAHEYVAFKAVARNGYIALDNPRSIMEYVVSAFQNAEPLVAFLAAAVGLFAILALNSIARNLIALARRPAELPIKLEK